MPNIKIYKEFFKTKEDIPEELLRTMSYGFLITYGDDIITGWCTSFIGTAYNEGMTHPTDNIGLKIKNVILCLEDGYYHHSFINVLNTASIFFPKEA